MTSEHRPIPDESATAEHTDILDGGTEPGDRLRRSAALLLTYIVLGGGTSGLQEAANDEQRPMPSIAVDQHNERPLPPQGGSVCADIPEGFMQRAISLMQSRENPAVTRAVGRGMRQDVTGPPIDDSPFSVMDGRKAAYGSYGIRFHVVQKVANDLHLTVFNPQPFVQEATKGRGIEDPRSIADDFLKAAKRFMNKYGIELDLADSDEKLLFGARRPTTNDLKTSEVKYALYNSIKTVGNLPKEYIELSGIKRIKIVADAGGGSGESNIDVQAYTNGETVWLDGLDRLDDDVLAHELAHGVHNAMCGGSNAASGDNRFAKQTRQYSADIIANSRATYEKYHASLEQEEIEIRRGRHDGRRLARLQKAAKQTTQTVTAYAGVSVAEDFAETMRELTTDGIHDVRHVLALPRLRDKFAVALGRLAYYRPAIAQFFMQTTMRPEHSTSPLDAIMLEK